MVRSILERDKLHLALLGDSVFDSRAYLPGAPNAAERVRQAADPLRPIRTSLMAVSGSRLRDLPRQVARTPDDATHLVVSIGGNDVLDLGARLRQGAGGWLERMRSAEPLLAEFRERYAAACEAVAALSMQTAVCALYQPPVSDPMLRMLASAVSDVVNKVVTDEARDRGFDVIDLRKICRAPEDFYDPIHPSARAADKIAKVIADWALGSRSQAPIEVLT
jgi:lysophospholipase L1-like esterase